MNATQDVYSVTRIGTLQELQGKGHEFLLSADRTQVIAYLIDGMLARVRPVDPELAEAETIPSAA